MLLFSPAQIVLISIAHLLKSQTLGRTPEPSSPSPLRDGSSVLTDDHRAVSNYTRAMETKMALLYAAVLDVIHRTRPPGNGGRALDVACGPGHLAIDLARHMGYDQVLGVDLSEPMIRAAEINAKQRGVADRVRFQMDDATRLSSLPDNHFDLSAITFAAHHFDKIDSVRQILLSLERVTRPEGIVFLFDVIRLKTRRNTEHYIRVLGHDYSQRGLRFFLDDFRNSMYAAFTCGELKTAVPSDSRRSWIHWTPRFVPSMQILIGLPVGRKKVFLRPFFKKNPLLEEWTPHWKKTLGPRWAHQTRWEGSLNKMTLATGKTEDLSTKALHSIPANPGYGLGKAFPRNLNPGNNVPDSSLNVVAGPLTCRVCDHHALVPRPEDLGHVRGNTARFKNRSFTLWRCPKCRSIANIEPVDYKDIYRDYPMLKQRLDFFARATFKNLLRRLTQAGLRPGQSVLDIGCGVGVFVEWLKTQGFNNVTGFDPMVTRFASDPVGQQFDCVVANDVLEHVENPRAFLKDAASRVKPGGLLYVGTADAGGVRDMSNLAKHAVRLHQPFHRIIVTAETLDRLTGELGFIPIGKYRRSYLDTRRPFCNYRGLDELSRALGHDMDLCFDPAHVRRAFTNPRVLFFGFFGYYFPSADEPAVILRKPEKAPSL